MADGNKKGNADDLATIRERINEVDEQIQSLINERARFAQ
jgi:chorismate mutase